MGELEVSNRTLLMLGGTGGLGKQLIETLQYDYEIEALGSKDCDIRSAGEVARVIKYSMPDYILNLAVVNYDAVLHKTDTTLIQDQLEVNLVGNINVLHSGIEFFRSVGKPGKIILMSSILASRPLPGTGIYGACKAAVEHLVQTAALENGSKNITINAIEAGYFDAGLMHRIPKDIQTKIIDSIPMKRLGNVEELANTIRFIFEVDYVNGSSIKIAGGL